jgi:iron complex outermembrane receptor protein
MFAQGGYGIANNVIGNANVNSIGVPPLRPQTVTSVEAVASVAAFDALNVDAGFYVQNVDDRIVFNQLATDFVAVNEEPRTSLGTILSARLRVDRFSSYATVSGQLQVQDDGLSPAPPPGYPNIFGTAGVNVDVPEARLRFNAHLRWAGERGATQSNRLLNDDTAYTLDPYATLDLTVGTVDLRLWNDSETRLTFSVRNLFDTRFSEPGYAGFDIPNLGRTFWVEVRQVF